MNRGVYQKHMEIEVQRKIRFDKIREIVEEQFITNQGELVQRLLEAAGSC